jgi:hypothetical protein
MNKKLIFFVFFLILLFYLNKIGIINYKNRGYCNLCLILYGAIVLYSIIKDNDVNDDIDSEIIEGFVPGVPICGDGPLGSPTHNQNDDWIRGDNSPDNKTKPSAFFETSNNLWYYTENIGSDPENQAIITDIMERNIRNNNNNKIFTFNDEDICQCPSGTILRAIEDPDVTSGIIWGCIPSCDPNTEHKHFEGTCVCSINTSGDGTIDRHVKVHQQFINNELVNVKQCINNDNIDDNTKCSRNQYIRATRRSRTCEDYSDGEDGVKGPCPAGEERYYDGNCVCSKGNYRTRDVNGELVCEPSSCPADFIRISNSEYLSECIDIGNIVDEIPADGGPVAGCRMQNHSMGRCSRGTCLCQDCDMNRHCKLNYWDYTLDHLDHDETCTTDSVLHNSWCEPRLYSGESDEIDSGTVENNQICSRIIRVVSECSLTPACDTSGNICMDQHHANDEINVDCTNINEYIDFLKNNNILGGEDINPMLDQCREHIRSVNVCGTEDRHICEQPTPGNIDLPSSDPVCIYLGRYFGPEGFDQESRPEDFERPDGLRRTFICQDWENAGYCMSTDENGHDLPGQLPIDLSVSCDTPGCGAAGATYLSCCNVNDKLRTFHAYVADRRDYRGRFLDRYPDGLERIENCEGFIRDLWCDIQECPPEAEEDTPDNQSTIDLLTSERGACLPREQIQIQILDSDSSAVVDCTELENLGNCIGRTGEITGLRCPGRGGGGGGGGGGGQGQLCRDIFNGCQDNPDPSPSGARNCDAIENIIHQCEWETTTRSSRETVTVNGSMSDDDISISIDDGGRRRSAR